MMNTARNCAERSTFRFADSSVLHLYDLHKEENVARLITYQAHLGCNNNKPVVMVIDYRYMVAGIHDITLTVLKWHSGASAHISVSWLHPYKEHRLVVVGDKAMLVFDDTKEKQKLTLYNRGIDFIKGQPVKISVLPTLLVSSLGIIEDVGKVVSMDLKFPGDLVYILGSTGQELGGGGAGQAGAPELPGDA